MRYARLHSGFLYDINQLADLHWSANTFFSCSDHYVSTALPVKSRKWTSYSSSSSHKERKWSLDM